jgi:hypothetical protein
MTYANEIIEDVKHFHGSRFISKNTKENMMGWKEAIAKYNSLTPEEHEALTKLTKERRGY